MRSKQSIRRLFNAIKSCVYSQTRRENTIALSAVIETLEPRQLLTAAADIRIPLLTYHQLIDSASADPTANASNTIFANFEAQMDWFHSQGFSTISLNTLKAWLASPVATGVTVPGTSVTMPSKPFVMFFDDANETDLRGYKYIQEQGYGFEGVTSIPSANVNPSTTVPTTITASNNSTYWSGVEGTNSSWGDIKFLINAGWDVASHTVDHDMIGFAKLNKSSSQVANTPSGLVTELSNSKSTIATMTGVTPIAFVHPFDAATTRSLSVASQYYDLVIGASYRFGGLDADPLTSTAIKVQPISSTSGPQDGGLVRVPMDWVTQISDLTGELTDQLNPSTEVAYTPEYAQAYLAKDGTVVVDGDGQNQTITVNSGGTVNISTLTMAQLGEYADVFKTGVYNFSVTASSVNVMASAGNDTVVNNSTFGGLLDGGSGNDSMTGGSGNETLNGEAGDDTLVGSNGNDTFIGGSGTDLADASSFGSGLKVNWSIDGVANDTVYVSGVATYTDSIDTDNLQGTAGNDTLTGDSNPNKIVGGGGNDSIIGQGGNDNLEGDAGNDTMEGDAGNDTIDGGSNDDSLIGGSGTDSMLGESGNDILNVLDGAGGDTADGGSGTDSLVSSGGIDHDTGDVILNIP
jgi:Ca2+-binding RTX toxin-like protein